MQSLVFKTLVFAGESNQWVKVLSSTISLNWGKCPKCPKCCKFNSQLAKEKVTATNKITKILLKKIFISFRDNVH